MRQTVKVISEDGLYAVVSYHRPSACHMDCSACSGGCGSLAASEITVRAKNTINAHAGDCVVIEGSSSKVGTAMFLVYILPMILFFIGYALMSSLGHGTAGGICGFLAGVAIAVAAGRYQRKHGSEIRFEIVSYAL